MIGLSDLPQDFLKKGHRIQKAASGVSMLPAIPDGTVLQIEPVQQNNVKLGDVVYFLDNNGQTKIHRVSLKLRKGTKMLAQTWGDNNEKPDAVIKRSQILGIVTAYRGKNDWHPIASPTISYMKFFLKKYGWYYLYKIPGRLLYFLNRQQ